VLELELRQKSYADAAVRAEELLRDHADELMESGQGLISVGTWLDALLGHDRPAFAALAAEYERQFGPAARQALLALRGGQAVGRRPDEFYTIARRFRLSSVAAEALAAAGDRAAELGDVYSAHAYYTLAGRDGWTPTGAAAERAQGIYRLATGAARAGYVGPVPCPAKWYAMPEGFASPKYLPYLAGDTLYLASGESAVALREDGAPVWSFQLPRAVVVEGMPVHPMATGRGPLLAPAVLTDASGAAQILVVRQFGAREWCLRGLRASDGKVLWTSDSDAGAVRLSYCSTPVVAGRYVYAVGVDSSPSGAMGAPEVVLAALDVMSGKLLWRAGLGRITEPPAVHGRIDPRGIRAEDFWNQGPVALEGDAVYLTPNVGHAMAVGAFDGKLRWVQPYEEKTDARQSRLTHSTAQVFRWKNTPAVLERRIVSAPQDTSLVVAFDRENGQGSFGREEIGKTVVGRVGGAAILAGADAVTAVDADLTTRWSYLPPEGTTIIGPPVVIGSNVYVPTSGGTLVFGGEDGMAGKPEVKLPDVKAVVTSAAAKGALGADVANSFMVGDGRRK